MKKRRLNFLFVILCVLAGVGLGAAIGYAAPAVAPSLAPVATAFTYQGHLEDGGGPANGLYDFEFELFNDPVTGSQVGGTLTLQDVNVTDGVFTVELDFGDVFDETALWLEIHVRPGASTGGYQQLLPRQVLTPVPYASFARHAAWDGLIGVPAGFADGIDDEGMYSAGTGLELVGDEFRVETGYRLPQGCSGSAVPKWSGMGWICAGDKEGVTQVYNGDGLDRSASGSEVTLSVDFAGSGAEATAARSDHTHAEFTAFGDRLTVLETEKPVLAGHLDTPTNDGITVIEYPFTFDLSGLGPNVEPSNVHVVASGFKKASDGTPEQPLMIRWEVSDMTLTLWVWDSDGIEFKSTAPIPPQWAGPRVELDFIVIRGD